MTRNVLTKPLSQITDADIQKIREERMPEGSDLEFKETLPSETISPDPWFASQ